MKCAKCNAWEDEWGTMHGGKVSELEAEKARLREALADIREIYTGSEGIPKPETAAEAYVLRLVEQMYSAAVDALNQGGDTAGGGE